MNIFVVRGFQIALSVLEMFSVSYLTDRYFRSGCQDPDLLWSAEGHRPTHDALGRVLYKWSEGALLSRSVMASASGSSASRCSSSSFHHSSRYSTSTVRSFSADSLQPRLHGRFGEETSIRSITDDLEPEQESFTRYHGNSQDQSSWDDTFGGYQGNERRWWKFYRSHHFN